jgi:hypothetical protein
MQFSVVAIVTALAATVSAHENATASPVWVTDVVTSFTTVCPAATTLSFNGVTYTATESETITITNCPCTVSKPVYITSSVVCATCSPAVPSAPVYANSTAATTIATSKGSVSSSPISSAPLPGQTVITANSGNRVLVFSGASLAGLLAVAAYIL